MNNKIVSVISICLVLMFGVAGCDSTSHYFVKARTATPQADIGETQDALITEMVESTTDPHTQETVSAEATTETTHEVAETHIAETSTEVQTTEEPHAEDTATAEGEHYCGQSGTLTFLVIGSGSPNITSPDSASMIRVVRANFNAQTLKIVSFPADLIVKTASVNQTAQIESSLKTAYQEAFSSNLGETKEKTALGAGVISQLLYDNFGIQTDHMLVVQIDQFGAMVDTIEGVEVNIEENFTTDHGMSFEKGMQIMHGPSAIEYLSYLGSDGEAARIARQDAFLLAMQSKTQDLDIIPYLPGLISQLQYGIFTDLEAEQLIGLSCLAVSMPEHQTTFGTLTNEGLMNGSYPNTEIIQEYLQELFGD